MVGNFLLVACNQSIEILEPAMLHRGRTIKPLYGYNRECWIASNVPDSARILWFAMPVYEVAYFWIVVHHVKLLKFLFDPCKQVEDFAISVLVFTSEGSREIVIVNYFGNDLLQIFPCDGVFDAGVI